MNRQLDSHRFTLEDTIRAVLNSSDIVDIALIKKISDDKKFVDVEHIIKPELYDYEKEEYVEQESVLTNGVELMYLGSSYFSLKWEVKIGDPVLLLGLKRYIDKIDGKTKPEKSKMYAHYQQETYKAIPLGFNANAKAKINISDADKKITLTTDSAYDLEITAHSCTIKSSSTGWAIKDANGNTIALDNSLIDLHNTVSNLKAQLEDIWTAILSINTNLQSFTSTNCAVGSPVTPNPATIALFVADNVTGNLKKTAVGNLLK
jgi:hypothetical protein